MKTKKENLQKLLKIVDHFAHEKPRKKFAKFGCMPNSSHDQPVPGPVMESHAPTAQ
jgi:hypothetical protein